jgi:hypothetical protein
LCHTPIDPMIHYPRKMAAGLLPAR